MTNLWKRSLSMFLAVVMVIGMLPMNVLAEGIDDTPTEPTSTETQPHEHAFNAGVCECGEKDPNYVPPHEHTFNAGVCKCGEKDPNYVPPHEHTFNGGVCECGEKDPNYVPPHEHAFNGGVCECGEKDPNYVAPHEHTFNEGVCECGEKDPNYVPPHEHTFNEGVCECGVACEHNWNMEAHNGLCLTCGVVCQHNGASHVETIDATCTEEGYELNVCDICTASFGEPKVLPVAEHVYVDGVCKCGAAEPGLMLAVENPVAKVGDTEYATIDEAIAAWTNGTTLTLLADVTLSDVIQLSSTEHHILDLGTYTMTAASKKDAIQIVNNGRTSASWTLDIKADASNPGGITASGKAVVRHSGSAKDRPITRFYNGVFNASYIVYHSGNNGSNSPSFYFYGGVYNGTIYTNRSTNIFEGGTFTGSLQMSVDSSAYTLIKGGTFKKLSNMMGSDLTTGNKFTIGSAKGANNGSVCVDENGNYVITTTAPAAAEAAVASNYNSSNYFYYSTVNTNGMYYEDVYDALEANTTGTVTVFTEELDLTDSSFKGTIVVPKGEEITIVTEEGAKPDWNVTATEGSVTYEDADGNELVKGEDGSYSVAEPVLTEVKVATLDELQTALADNSNDLPIVVTASIEIPAGETVELNLNGKTVNAVFNGTSTTNHIYALKNYGTLTIEDSSANARSIVGGSINSRGIYNYGSLTLNGGTINAIDGNGGYAVNNQSGSTFVMNGGVVAATNEDDHQSSSGGYDATALKVPSGGTATLNGGTITSVSDFTFAIEAAGTLNIPATSTIEVSGAHGAISVQGGTSTIDAGTFSIPKDEYTRTDNVLYVSGGSLVINGGTFTGDSDTASGGSCLCDTVGTAVVNGGTFTGSSGGDVWGTTGTTIKGGTFENLTEKQHIADGFELGEDGTVVKTAPTYVAMIGTQGYATLEEAFAAATEDQTITLLADATPNLTSQRAITKAAVIDLGGKTLTLTEDDLYFGTTTFKNGTIVVDPSVKPSTAVFWMFANQTLTFDNVKVVATGVTGTYLIGLDGNNSDLNLLNGSEIVVENTTALDLDIICVNASTGNDIVIDNSKVNVTNLDGRVLFRGNYTIKGDSELYLDGITKAGIRIEAGQTLSIEDTAKVTITGEPRDGGIHLTDTTATYTKADTATVSATVNKPTLTGSGTQEDPFIVNSLDALKIFRDMVNGGTTFDNQFVKLTADIDLNNEAWTPIGNATNKFLGTFDGDNHTISNLKVEGENNVGFFGYADGCVIKNLKIKNADVKGIDCVGAIAGQVYSTSTIDNCHVFGLIKIEGQTNVGGIVGKYYVRVSNSSVIGDGVATSYVKGTYVKSDFEGDNIGGIMGHGGESNNFVGNSVKNITISGTRKIGGIVGTTSCGTDVSGTTVENVVIKTTATAEYSESKADSMGLGGLIGHYHASGEGTVTNNTVTGVTFVIPEGITAEAGVMVGNDRKNPGREPVGVTVSGNTVTNVTGATNKYLIPAVAQVGTETYADLQEAIIAAAPSGTVELLSNVTVDKWIMFSETLTIGDGTVITLDMDGLTIDGNGHTLTIKDVESANNGNHIFFDGDYNVCDLTVVMGENVNGFGITSGTISNVTFIGGRAASGGAAIQVSDGLVYGVHAGNVTVEGCTFKNNGGAIYYETAQNGLVVNNNTFEVPAGANVILMRGTEQFTNNIVKTGRTVNVVSGSPVVTGNNFGDVRLKVYNVATATISNNTINNLEFNDATVAGSTFENNTLSADAQAKLDAVTRKPSGKVSYRAYITDNASREAVQIDLENVYARESLIVKVFDANDNLLFTTKAKASSIDATTYTVNAVLWGNPSGSWDTTIADGMKLTVANVPSKAELWIDGILLDTFENIMGKPTDAAAYQLPAYRALDCVYKEAKIGNTYYATIAEAIAAAQNDDTVVILPGEYGAINISNKNITIQGTVGDNGELLTTIKGGNPAITGHGFNGTIKDLKIVDAFKAMYAEPAGNVTVDNVHVTGATYGFHLVAYSTGLTWTIQNSYMDLSWANSFGVYGAGDAAIVIKGNEFASTNPYYPDYGALPVNTFLPDVTVEDNIFGAKTMIALTLTDTSKVNIGTNYYADGYANAFAEDSAAKVDITKYYAELNADGTIDKDSLVELPRGNNFNAYTGADGFWGEVWGNAKESFVIKILDANGNVMGTTSLNNIGGIINGNVNVTWNLKLNAASNTDEYWTMSWTTAPTVDNMPAKAELWVDGVKVSGGKVVLNGPDDLNKIVAAVANGEGVITGFYTKLADAIDAATAGNEIVLLADVAEDITVPAGVIFNGNGKQVGVITAAGEITFKGVTKATNFGTQYTNTTINIIEGACLEITGTGRLVIGHGCTFNITGNIENAKTVDKSTIQPSLIMPGASFTGAGVTFNVTNAYIYAPSSYCSSSKSASGTFDFNITNSIIETAGKLAFESQSTAATVNFELKDSVLTTGSHLVFGVSRGEVVIDNSNVNVGKSNQLENQSTMIIKNGSVVNGAVATSSNAKNPGTIIVDNATYAVTGEFSGSDLGTGTLIVKNGATVSAGSITKANIQIDATGLQAGDEVNLTANLSKLAGTVEVINNDKLEAKIVDGKIVLSVKPVAKIGDTSYTTLQEAFKAATEGCTIEILTNVTVDGKWDCRDYATDGSHSQFKESVTINGNGHTLKFTGTVNDNNWNTIFRFEENATVNNLTVDISEATGAQRVISAKKSLTVDGLTIIGSAKYGIIFGEGASADDLAVAEIVVKNSTLTGTRRAISDNEGGKDVKSVAITGNTLNANVYASASGSITFNNNTAAGEVDLRSYAANNTLSVVAQGNTLTEGVKNYIYAKTADAQAEFTAERPAFKVSTKAELNAAIAAVQDGDVIELLADITTDAVIVIDDDITFNGNGYTITSSANRVIRIAADVTINNLNMVSTAVRVDTNDIRGVSLDYYSANDDFDLVLNNCSVNFTDASASDWAYAVNQSGNSSTGNSITIIGGSYVGANVVNINGTGHTVKIDGATLTSIYGYNSQYYGLCVSFNDGANTAEIKNTTFKGNHAKPIKYMGSTVVEENNTDNTKIYVAQVGSNYYHSLAEAIAAAQTGDTITLLADIATSEEIINTKKITLDLNGKTITGTDNSTGSFGLITNKGELTITGNGKITLTATNDRDWNAYSSVISNQPGGKLTVESGTIEHLGGTDMAYGIDNLTNGKGTYAETIVNGGTVKSTYRAIRQFLNGIEAQNILTVNGGTIEGANKSIWMQDPSKNANTGKLTVGENATLNGDVYLFVTAGSTDWPVEVSIAADALKGKSTVVTGNVPAQYVVMNNNGTWGITAAVATVNGVGYATLAEAIAAAQAGEEIDLLCDLTVAATKGGYSVAGAVITDEILDGNGYTLTVTGANDTYGSGIYMTGGTVKNLTIKGSFRGIFSAGSTADINLDKVKFKDVVYTFNSDDGNGQYGVYISNSELNGWTSYSNVHKEVVITNTSFGEGSGYKFFRPYNNTVIDGCTFSEGYAIDGCKTEIAFKNVNADTAKTLVNGAAAFIETNNEIVFYPTLADAVAAAQADDTVTLLADIATSEEIINTKKITLDLNGKTITGTDNSTGSFGLITNKGELTITGNGKITLTATNDRDWNAYSSVISNQPGGKLTVESGTIEHLGGTDMAYGIDNLTNGKGTYAETIVNGGTVKSTYRAIRQFLNGIEAQNILTVNGGTIEGANKSIWMQDPSKNANSGTLNVAADATLKGDVYLTVTAGSTTWPVEVAIAAAALKDDAKVLSSNVPSGYDVANVGGTWGIQTGVAKIGNTYYATFDAAYAAAQAGETITLLADVTASEIITIDKAITLDGNGKTLTSTAGRAINVSGADGVTIKNLTIDAKGERAINIIQNATNVTIDNVTATAANYTVNVASSAPNAVVTIKGSDLTGLNVVNVGASGAKVTVTGGTITCNDQTDAENYAALFLNTDAACATITATDVTFDIKGDSFKATNSTVDGSITIDGKTDEVRNPVAYISYGNNAYVFYSLADAITAAKAGDTITLIRDVTLTELVKIEKAITLDLGGKKVTSTAQKAIEVYADATIQNGTIEAAQRCVDTRKAVELTLTDVKLIADKYNTAYGNPQPLTIGGSEDGTEVNMTNVNISTAAGYGIITFVKTELTATNSTIGGYSALYVKPGSEGSKFNFVHSDLSGSTAGNDAEGNSFSTIAVRADNVTVNVDADSTVKATGNYCWAISMESKFVNENGITGSTVNVAGTINGQILTSVDTSKNTISVKAEYADVLATAGYVCSEEANGMVTVLGKAVAKIGDKKFESLQAAIDAAQAGETITLLADIELDATVKILAGKTVTLDLNGKKIDVALAEGSTTNHIYAFENHGALTITGNGVINARGIFNYGAMTLTSGTINAIDANGGYAVRNYAGASFTMNGGTVATTNEDGDVPGNGYDATTIRVDEGAIALIEAGVVNNISNYTFAVENRGITTINGGEFTSGHTVVANYGNLTVNDGKFVCDGFDGQTQHVIWAADGTTTINGGTFDGKDTYNGFNVDASEGAVVKITGGTFLSVHSGSLYGEGTIAVSGGTFFDKVPENRCAEGYIPTANGDGTYGVKKGLRGSGTAEDPFIINNVSDLIFFRDSVNAGETTYNAPGVYVALAADIDLAGIDWSINIGDDCNATFDGIFDGKGHTIKNLTSTETAQKSDGYVCTGLFGAIYGSAVIKNLTIENANINTGSYTGNNAGIVVGFVYEGNGAVIENVKVTGDIQMNAAGVYGVGAIVGYAYYGNSLTIKNCVVDGIDGSKISASSAASGIIGYSSNYGLTVEKCTVQDVALEATAIAGGIAGVVTGGTFSNNTVNDVQLTVTKAVWKNSAAVVVGTLASTSVTVSDTTYSGVNATAIVGSQYAEHPTTPVAKVEARIGNTYYATLQDAIDAAQAGETITLLADVALSDDIMIDKSLTLELGDKKLEGELKLKSVDVSVTAPEGLNVTTDVADHKVVYENGMYKVVAKIYVAQIGEQKFESLQAAIDAAQAGDTVTLLAPVVVNAGETLTLGKDVTITYNSNVEGEDMFTVNGTLNVASGKITYVNNSNGNNVTVSTISAMPGSVVNVTGGIVENESDKADGSSSYPYAIDLLTNGSLGDVTVNISGGKVTSDYVAIRQFNNGDVCKNTLNITGGEIYGAKRGVQIHFKNNAAYLTVTGGSIKADGDYALCFLTTSENLAVSGGEIEGSVWYSGEKGFISGGVFSEPVPEEYCAEGYIPTTNDDGTYGVKKGAYVAKLGETKYESLQEAIDAAADGATIELLKNAGIGLAEKRLVIKRNGFEAKVAALSGYAVVKDDNAYIVKTLDDVIIDATGAKLAYIDVNNDGYKDEELMSLTTALYKAQSGDTVKLFDNLTGENKAGTVIIPTGITLNIEGHTLEADYIIGLRGSKLTGTSMKNDGTIRGKLDVPRHNVALSPEGVENASGYTRMPVWIENEGYVIVQMMANTSSSKHGLTIDDEEIVFKFRHTATTYFNSTLMKNNGAKPYGVSVVVRLQWNVIENGEVVSIATQTFNYTENHIMKASNPDEPMDYKFTLRNYKDMNVHLGSLVVTGEVISETGIVAASDPHKQ